VEQSVLEKNFENLGGLKNILPVDDTLFALQKMAQVHRKKFTVPLVGITGSNGKTTTKEMLAGILKQKGPVLKNEGNLNNHIGVPLTLLKMDRTHKAAVVEMGMSALGEIDMLSRLAIPDVGVITNIGPAHLEFLGSTDGVAQAKGELLANLNPNGTAVLNSDDRYFDALKSKYPGRVRSFGIDTHADVRATGIKQGREHVDFTIHAEGAHADVRLAATGKHNVYNALAAAAAALAIGTPLDAVKYGLDDFTPLSMRSEIRQLKGRTVLADCYNANPASVDAALAALVTLKPGSRTIAVLGDMLELGPTADQAHQEIGRTAARLGLHAVIAFGSFAKQIALGAARSGMPTARVLVAGTHGEAADLLRKLSEPGDVILVKGSRGMRMEKILEEF
jgi:UDP-N-acetylmuramoyl-tripeptide--D-alanyl-D-alanine ligase